MKTRVKRSLSALCPNCEETITFRKQPHRGKLVTCDACDEPFEVIQLNPIVLGWLEDEGEDDGWQKPDDDFDDFYFDD